MLLDKKHKKERNIDKKSAIPCEPLQRNSNYLEQIGKNCKERAFHTWYDLQQTKKFPPVRLPSETDIMMRFIAVIISVLDEHRWKSLCRLL